MTPAINEKDISLFQLRSELTELMTLRDTPDLEPEAKAAIEYQIKAYIGAELRKVDNIAGFIRSRKMRIKAAKEESARLAALAASWEAEEKFVIDLCKDAMIQWNVKKLEGMHATVALQSNGGLQPLEIPQPALVPEEFVQYRGWMSSAAMAEIYERIRGRQDFQFEREPHQGRIRAALAEACNRCKATGSTYNLDDNKTQCEACSGTGKRQVPGARLGDRGQHVRLK